MEKNSLAASGRLARRNPAPVGSQAAPVVAPKVVTIRWKSVSWQKTLSEILASAGYGFRDDEGIIRVMSLADLNNTPSETRVYRVTFADAKAVADTINSVFKLAARRSPPTVRSTAGPAGHSRDEPAACHCHRQADMLRASESKILEMIAQIDQPARQVVIESRIVETNWNNNFQFGFRYGYGSGSGSTGSFGPTGNTTNSNAYNNNVSSTAAVLGSDSVSNAGSGPLSFVYSEKDFKFLMDMLETDSTANVIQNPTVVIKDDGKGALRVITRTPYFEGTTSQGSAATRPPSRRNSSTSAPRSTSGQKSRVTATSNSGLIRLKVAAPSPAAAPQKTRRAPAACPSARQTAGSIIRRPRERRSPSWTAATCAPPSFCATVIPSPSEVS